MLFGYVYKTTNLVNGKIYIGQHKNSVYNPKYFGSGRLMLRAIEKYGIDNFKNEIIHICNSKEEMQKMEIYYIDKYQSFPKTGKGYNLTPGGEWGDVTFGMNEEQYEEYCNKFRGENNGMYGKHVTKEAKDKMSRTRKERGVGLGPKNPMYKSGERGIHPLLGSERSEETKNKISKSLKGNIPWNKGIKLVPPKKELTYEEKYMKNKSKKPIKVTNIHSGEVNYYESKKECSKYFDGVKYRLSVGKVLDGESLLFQIVSKEEYLKHRREMSCMARP